MFFEQYKHEPGIAIVRFWVAYSEDPPPAADLEARRTVGYAALDGMERHLGDHEYFVGERPDHRLSSNGQ
jgi:glutathione S-transferase